MPADTIILSARGIESPWYRKIPAFSRPDFWGNYFVRKGARPPGKSPSRIPIRTVPSAFPSSAERHPFRDFRVRPPFPRRGASSGSCVPYSQTACFRHRGCIGPGEDALESCPVPRCCRDVICHAVRLPRRRGYEKLPHALPENSGTEHFSKL